MATDSEHSFGQLPSTLLGLLAEVLDRPVILYRPFVDIGGSVNAALLLNQCLYWQRRARDPDGWFWKTSEGWREELGLSREELATARKKLIERGLIQEKKKGIPPILHYRVCGEALEAALRRYVQARPPLADMQGPPPSADVQNPSSVCVNPTIHSAGIPTYDVRESRHMMCGNPEVLTSGIPSYISESTSENISESTSESTPSQEQEVIYNQPVYDSLCNRTKNASDCTREVKNQQVLKVSNSRGLTPAEPYPEGFEGFWLAYRALGGRVRLSKAGAAKSYQRALTRGATPDALMDGLRRFEHYLQARERDDPKARDFVPMAETWLNQDRHLDEYLTPRRRKKNAELILERMFGGGTPRDPPGVDAPLLLPFAPAPPTPPTEDET